MNSLILDILGFLCKIHAPKVTCQILDVSIINVCPRKGARCPLNYAINIETHL